ncbi:MAG: hypothetical protein ACMXYC_03725 [Candidatus Woesearchaeota archaeon]
MKSFIQHTTRDLLGLGSWIMYLLVLARSMIDMYRPFVDQMLIAGMFLLLLYFTIPHNGYTARIIVIAYFTSLFYQSTGFTIFISIITLLIIYSALQHDTKKNIVIGCIIGGTATALGYFIPTLYTI